jgi:hypothetical protein
VVLVEALRLVADRETTVEVNVHGTLIRTHLDTITITLWCYSVEVKEAVLVRDTILEDDGHIVAKVTILLVEYVPTIIRVSTCTATIEVVVVTNRDFWCETVSIALVLVAVEVRVTVDDLVVRTEVLNLQTGITILVEVTELDDIVVTVLSAVYYVSACTTCRFVALDEQTIIRSIADIDVLEVPV